MNAINKKVPTIHPEFKHLIQPIIDKDLEQTDEVLPNSRSDITIDAWNGYLLCDEGLYKIFKTDPSGFKIIDHDFSTVDEAGSFICTKQLHRKDLTNSFRKYLIGKKFGFEEGICRARNNEGSNSKYRIAYKIGESQNLSGGAVLKYNVFSTAIDIIIKNAEDFGQILLMEQVRVSHENTIELSRLAPNEIRHLANIVSGQRLRHLTYQDIRQEVKSKHTNPRSNVSRNEKREQSNSSPTSIRQMPAYNPDADVNSLCMTIGSWVSSMDRVIHNVDFSTISSKALIDLVRQLTILEQTVTALRKSLAERDIK